MPEGVTYDITVDGLCQLLEIDGFVREVRFFKFYYTSGEGKLVDWFAADPALLPKALVGCEDTDQLVV